MKIDFLLTRNDISFIIYLFSGTAYVLYFFFLLDGKMQENTWKMIKH